MKKGMKKSELAAAVSAYKTETQEAMQTMYDALNQGQKKQIVKDEDVQFLSESAFADACRPGNPRDTSVEEIAALYRKLL